MRTFTALIQKEFLQIRRNSFLPKLIIIFPIMIMLIMPLVMTMDVRNVNVAVVDNDNSTASRRIASHINGSEYLTLAATGSQYSSISTHCRVISAPLTIRICTLILYSTQGYLG